MDKRIRKLYRKRMSGGKSGIGFIFDRILSIPLLYLVCTLLLREMGLARASSSILALGVSGIVIVLYLLIFRIRLDRFIARERKAIIKKLCIREAMLMSKSEFVFLAKQIARGIDRKGRVFVHRSLRPLDGDLAACACRMGRCVVVSLAQITPEAEEFLNAAPHVQVASEDKVIEGLKRQLGYDNSRADEELMHTESGRKKKFTIKPAISPYAVCGVILFALSFILRFSLYYRLLGVVCMWLAGYYFIKKRLKQS